MIRFREAEYEFGGNLLQFYDTNMEKDYIASVKLTMYEPGSYYLTGLFVGRDRRREGFATRLMERVIILYGKNTLTLAASPYIVDGIDDESRSISKSKLLDFYTSFGFRAISPVEYSVVNMQRRAQ